MARYVDANKLQAKYDKMLNDFLKMGISIGAAAIKHALKEIDDMPAADVRPERHGKWNELSLDDQDEGMYICSKCKSIEFMPEECDIYAYCPNCGAKMDGKDGESDG